MSRSAANPMTTTPPAAPASDTASGRSIYLSGLLGRPLADRNGQPLGKLADVIVRLRGAEYPLVTGLVGTVGGREVFVRVDQVSSFDGEVLKLTSARLDLRWFERRDGELLLRADVLGHRLIDVSRARLVRAGDLRLSRTGGDWVLDTVDTRWRPRRLFGLLGRREQPHQARDWREFEPLIGHTRSAVLRGPFARIRLLKPTQIADLLEDASKAEETEILGHVHADPELEADVFEELDEELATRAAAFTVCTVPEDTQAAGRQVDLYRIADSGTARGRHLALKIPCHRSGSDPHLVMVTTCTAHDPQRASAEPDKPDTGQGLSADRGSLPAE